MCKISVIIPTLCSGQYLRENVLSLSRQSLDHSLFEVLYIINGQDVPYKSHLEGWLKQTDLQYKIIHTSHKGASHARNVGLDIAFGEYIAFIDDDDKISEFYLESLLKVSSDKVIGVSSHKAYRETSVEEVSDYFLYRKMLNPEQYLSRPFFQCRSVLSVCYGKLIHRNIIRERRFDERFSLGEDALFMSSLTDRFSSLRYAGTDAIYSVILRNGSTMHKRYSLGYLIRNTILLWGAYIRTYFSNPKGYSLLLFLMRFPGVVKNSFVILFDRY